MGACRLKINESFTATERKKAFSKERIERVMARIEVAQNKSMIEKCFTLLGNERVNDDKLALFALRFSLATDESSRDCLDLILLKISQSSHWVSCFEKMSEVKSPVKKIKIYQDHVKAHLLHNI